MAAANRHGGVEAPTAAGPVRITTTDVGETLPALKRGLPTPPPVDNYSPVLSSQMRLVHRIAALPPVEGVPTPFRLRHRLEQWKTIASPSVVRLIREGIRVEWASHVRPNNRASMVSTGTELVLETVVRDYIRQGILCETPQARNLCSYFNVQRKSGKPRLVTDFTPVNLLACAPDHFRLVSPHRVGEYLRPNVYMVVVDLSDAYNHLHLHPRDQPFCCIRFRDQILRWNGAGFGLRHLPLRFTQVLRAALHPLRASTEIIDYLDDLLLMHDDPAILLQQARLLIRYLRGLGWSINEDKCSLVPSRTMEFLGYVWNTSTMTMSLGMARTRGIQQMVSKLLRRRQWHVRDMQRSLGTLQHAHFAVSDSKLHVRGLQSWLHSNPSHGKFPPSTEARLDLMWWQHELTNPSPQPLLQFPVVEEWATDASDTGWGAWNVTTDARSSGFFRSSQLDRRIEWKEIYACVMALQMASEKHQKATVIVHTDNRIALSYISKMKGGRKPHLTSLLHRVHHRLRQRQISVIGRWISTHDNVIADGLSRRPQDRQDYSVCRREIRRACQHFGIRYPTLDLFATASNSRCRNFVSRNPEPGAFAVDALAQTQATLRHQTCYANPPWKLIPRVLRHLHLNRIRCLLLLPCWTTKSWLAYAAKVARHPPFVVPTTDRFFTNCFGQAMPKPRWNVCWFLL